MSGLGSAHQEPNKPQLSASIVNKPVFLIYYFYHSKELAFEGFSNVLSKRRDPGPTTFF